MAEGYAWPRRQQVAVGTADQAQPAGRQRDQGSLRCLSYACVAWPPRQQVEPGTARPLTLSNAVPWVRSERDTFRSNQLLVVGRRRGASN